MSLISSIFNSSSDPLISLANMCPVLSTPIDWKETQEAHIFMVDLPGLYKEDVKVEVDEKSVLHISGEWKVEKDDDKNVNNNKWHRVERHRGEFSRKFRLPENVKADDVKASMENGVLTVIVPKQEVKKIERKVIEIEEK